MYSASQGALWIRLSFKKSLRAVAVRHTAAGKLRYTTTKQQDAGPTNQSTSRMRLGKTCRQPGKTLDAPLCCTLHVPWRQWVIGHERGADADVKISGGSEWRFLRIVWRFLKDVEDPPESLSRLAARLVTRVLSLMCSDPVLGVWFRMASPRTATLPKSHL